jgi:hypothetical protein
LTNTSSIGDTIGGITAPLLGIISSIFLYLTLNKQIDSIKDQKLKNESDIIFLLINQLENEYQQIYINETSQNIKSKLFGHEALTTYTNSVYKFYNTNDTRKFGDYYIANHILLVIQSFKLIEERIKISPLSHDIKIMFYSKLRIFYNCKLKDPLDKLAELFGRVPSLNDDCTAEIIEFAGRMKVIK